MELGVPEMEAVETLADLWVELATGQLAYGSHLFAAANRDTIRAALMRFIVADKLIVARENDSIIGFVMFDVEDGMYQQDVTRGIVMNIYVEPSFRGQGIGSELLAAAEEQLRDAGAETVALDVMAANTDAIRFYERHGYHSHRVELEKHIESDNHSKEKE
ncbi:GNAT family N-acetyltransferase [Haladaptatus sp. DJG-WS-42]|uniref:GNAT family N-acetyltransferase n=1 Tax=Haladaptatus sp. DJG-WS-42 TaxID=3120516 RepID=UPI0030D1E98E